MRSQFRRFSHPTRTGTTTVYPVVANKKLIVASVVVWSLPGIAFGISTVVSGNLWVAAATSVLGIVAARAILRRYVATLTNDQSVVATEHAVDGRIEAIEVFWRPGCPFLEGPVGPSTKREFPRISATSRRTQTTPPSFDRSPMATRPC
jgi:hypothetical protein